MWFRIIPFYIFTTNILKKPTDLNISHSDTVIVHCQLSIVNFLFSIKEGEAEASPSFNLVSEWECRYAPA